MKRMENKINRLASIAQSRSLTADDRDYIKQLSEEMGVAFSPRTRCADCYRDQAILLLREVKNAMPKDDGRKYHLKAHVDVIYKGMRINEATLTDEIAEDMLRTGLPKHWFLL